MPDTEVYLEKLSLFGRLLRQEGMVVSPKETEDACTVLLSLGLEDRNRVKTALRAVYAKSRDEQLRFDRVFDGFFLTEDQIRVIDKKHTEQEQQRQEAIRQAEQELPGQGEAYSEAEKEAYSLLSEQDKQKLRSAKERFANGPDRSEALYNNFINSIFAKYIQEQQMRMEDAALGAEAVDPEMGLIFRDISEFQDQEIPRAVAYIQTLASQINGELTKSRKKSGRSSALDFRRTIRRGLETGGSFYRLAYKVRKKKRKQLLILCDVSASMIRFSEFALRLILALNDCADSSRVILFSESSAEADRFHLQNMDLFREYVRDSGIYGKGTDLNGALKRINEERPPALSASTVLIIVSDAMTVNAAQSCNEILRARARAGKVLFLNPIAERKWKFSNCIQAASKCCTMIPCSTLAELGAACRKLAFL